MLNEFVLEITQENRQLSNVFIVRIVLDIERG